LRDHFLTPRRRAAAARMFLEDVEALHLRHVLHVRWRRMSQQKWSHALRKTERGT
jgi:hypothetical protein